MSGTRTKILGIPAPDVEGTWFAAEVKSYAKAPTVPRDQLIKLCAITGSERLRLFIFKRPGWSDYIVCAFLEEFQEWFGKLAIPQKEKKEV